MWSPEGAFGPIELAAIEMVVRRVIRLAEIEVTRPCGLETALPVEASSANEGWPPAFKFQDKAPPEDRTCNATVSHNSDQTTDIGSAATEIDAESEHSPKI